MISNAQKLTAPNGLIDGVVEGYRYFFNPNGHQGPLVFFGDALDVFERCLKGSDIPNLKAVLPWANENPERLEKILVALGKLEVVNLGEEFSRELAAEQLRKKTRKMSVWFQLTDVCNLRCPYCYIHKKPTHMDLELGKVLIGKLVDDSARAGIEEVIIKLAGGEPTLRWSEGRALIDWAEKQFFDSSVRVKFHIITNGTMLPGSLLEYLEAGKLGISVSLDGVGKWHDRHRFYQNGRGSFLDVEKNLETLLSHGLRPPILTTVTRDNLHGITELAEYCWQRDLGFRFSLYREEANSPVDLRNDNEEVIRELLKCYSWMEDHLPERDFFNYHQFGDVNFRVPKIRNCGIGTSGITLTSDGKFCLCQYEMSDPLGDVQTSDFTQIMKEQKRFSLLENRVDRYPVCAECKWRFACAGGCPYLTKHQYGTFCHASPYCDVYRAVLPVLLRLHALQIVRRFQKKGGDSYARI
jgi:uncharacterized protein